MKTAVIFYHKNIESIYKERWISKCVNSIATQTFADFDVHELDYAGTGRKLAEIPGKSHTFYDVEMDNHIHAMNFLLDELFTNQGYDVVFNTNMDDYYSVDRFQKQVDCTDRYDLISSDFCYIEEYNDIDVVTHHMNICSNGDIADNLRKKHNVIAHPCVCFTKAFWDGTLRYKDLLGWEDLELWMQAIVANKRLHIIDDELLYYRIHQKQVTKTYNNIK